MNVGANEFEPRGVVCLACVNIFAEQQSKCSYMFCGMTENAGEEAKTVVDQLGLNRVLVSKFSNLKVGVPGDVGRAFEQSSQAAVLELFELSDLCVGKNVGLETVQKNAGNAAMTKLKLVRNGECAVLPDLVVLFHSEHCLLEPVVYSWLCRTIDVNIRTEVFGSWEY